MKAEKIGFLFLAIYFILSDMLLDVVLETESIEIKVWLFIVIISIYYVLFIQLKQNENENNE